MELVWLVYGISLLHGFGGILIAITVIAFCIAVALTMYRMLECNQAPYYGQVENKHRAENGEWAVKHVKTALITAFTCLVLNTLLPTEKTAYMMVGAYAAQKIAENDKVQETGGKVLTIINQKLDEYVDEGIKKATDKAEKSARQK